MLISELWQINFQTFIRCFHWVKNIKQNKNAYHEMSMTEFSNKSWNTTSGLINDVNWKKKNVYPKLIQKYVYIQDTKHHWSSYHVPGRTSWMVRLQTSCNLYMESIKTYFNSAVVTVYFSNLYWSHFSVITIDLPEKLTVLRRRLAGLLSLHLHMLGISKNYEVCIEAIEIVTLTSVEVNTPSYLCSSDSPKRILDTFES